MRSKLFLSLVVVPAVVAGLLGIVFFLAQFDIFFEKTEDELVETLRNEDAKDLRWFAAYELGARNLEGGVPALSEALRRPDPAPEVRWHAALALAHIGSHGSEAARAEAPLIVTLLDDPDPRARVIACQALVTLDEPDVAGPPLLQRLDAEDAELRQAVCWALGELGVEGAREPLRETLDDPVEGVRWNAALALTQLGDGAARPVLHEMLEEGSEKVVRNAVTGLGRVGDESSIDPLEQIRAEAEGLPLAEDAGSAIEAIRERMAAEPTEATS